MLQNHYDVKLQGVNTEFDRTSAYWGAHVGLQWDLAVTEKVETRIFANYFYDGREKESFTQAGNDAVAGSEFSCDAIHAHRLRLGAKFEYDHSASLKPYLSVALEET